MASELRVGDPSSLHLRKELTQIRKASRVLRDPATTTATSSSSSFYRPPLPLPSSSSPRSAPPPSNRPVFLHNWQIPHNPHPSADYYDNNSPADDDDQQAAAADTDAHLSSSSATASNILRCRDAAALVSPSITLKKHRGKKTLPLSDVLSRYQQHPRHHHPNLNNFTPLLPTNRRPSLPSVDNYSDYTTDDCTHSEDLLRKFSSSASPLLLKLKHKNWSRSPSTFARKTSVKDHDSSYSYNTPALSTSSYNRYYNRNPSTVGSWDATTTTSLNDGDNNNHDDDNDDVDVDDDDDDDDDHLDHLPGSRGCGIPCYWSKKAASCCSPSLSDTLRRKGSRILCGSQAIAHHRSRRSSSVSNRRRIASRSAQGVLPLLAGNGGGRPGSSICTTACSDDELSTNFGELDLEALSRLDGRRWSNCRSTEEGLEIVPVNGDLEGGESTPESMKSLTHKYKPVFFSELIGQNIVVQSLTNSITRGRIAPVYLFQGPRGTGKTSAARIFSSALNCTSSDVTKPCGFCSSCTDFISGKSRFLWEFDGTNKQGADKIRYLLKKVSQAPRSASSHFQVFLIDECHLLPSKLWLAFLKFLEEPPQRVVFIFITTDPDNVPRTVQSRCQKYLFNKIKDADIISRLKNISTEENLDVETDALDLIALNADGSLRDAETMLDQLSLLGKKITTSLVNELVGVVSDEKLLELLELALLSDTAETVKRSRDLMDSGVDPMVLMSQMASLIMDIIAGTGNTGDGRWGNSFFGGRSLTEAEVGRLKNSLKLLSEAEKQLRFSNDRSTWFTATLLQLGSVPSLEITHSSSSKRGSSRTTEEDPSSASREVSAYRRKSDHQLLQRRSSSPASLYDVINGSSCHLDESELNGNSPHSRLVGARSSSNSQDESMSGDTPSQLRDSEKLDIIWEKCVEKCHSKTLRQLLHSHGKLLSIAELEGVLVVYIAFFNEEIKARAERFMSSITNSIEMVLRRNVEVKLILVSDGNLLLNGSFESGLRAGKLSEARHADKQDSKANQSNAMDRYLELHSQQESLRMSRGEFSGPEPESKHKAGEHSKSSTMLDGTVQSDALSPELLPEAGGEDTVLKETVAELPMQRIESIIREQRLETAWLQAAEKGTPGTLSRLKPEKNQVLPQEGIYHNQSQKEKSNSAGLSPHQWEDELTHELKVLKMQDAKVVIKDQIGRSAGQNPMSPSMLHRNSMVNKESLGGYESSTAGRGCSGLFCWNTQKSQRGKGKVAIARSRRRVGGFSLFGECGKQTKSENRGRRR
ncbi:Protein STICHEL [Linum grandiflorum]